MVKKEKFVVIDGIRKLIVNIDKYLVNFPKKEIEIKQQISVASKEMLLYAYEANSSENKEKRIDLQEKIIARLKYVDFLINLCYEKQIINGKRYLKFGESLDYILKYTNGWKKSTETQKNN